MESRAFLDAFTRLPKPLADRLDQKLDQSNGKDRAKDEARLVGHFRDYLSRLTEPFDLAVFGHVHGPVDESDCRPRLVVLGGWHHGGGYLRVDDRGASHVTDLR